MSDPQDYPRDESGEKTEPMTPAQDDFDEDDSWLCDCGNWIDDGLHCTLCGAEPPWGCPCAGCQDGPDGEDDWEDDPDFWEDEL